MPKAFTPEWGLDIQNQVPVTARPDFLLPVWDRRAELNSFTGRSKHPGSKPRFAHRHQSWQMEPRRLVAEQAVILPETQVPPIIEGVEAIDSPLMAAAFFAVIGSGEWGKKNVFRLLAAILVLAGCTGVIRQESTPTPEIPPAVVVVTNTPLPDLGLTHTATLAATPTETPFFGGGPEFKPGSAADLQSLIDTNSLKPAVCVDINSSQYLEIRANLQAQGANIDALKTALENNLKPDQSLKLLCQQEGWAFVAVDGKGNTLWSWDLTQNQWADHMDAVLSTGWEFRGIEARLGYKSEVVILGGQPWLVEFKDGAPARYFDTLVGEFRDFRWDALAGTDKLITQFDWNGIQGTRILADGSLEVSGFSGVDGGLVINRTIQMVDITGDFSFGAKFAVQAGVGGGLAFIDRDPAGLQNWWESRQLHIIVSRESNGQNGLWIGYRDFSKEPVTLHFENSIPPKIDGEDVVEIKFRPGTDGITVVINGRELDTVTAKGLLANAKLSLGVSAGQNAENTVSEFFVNVPNNGQDNVRLEGMLPESTATSAATAVATRPAPELTPRPTAIPATAIPRPSPTFTLQPELTATLQPEGFISTRGVLPTREELIGCATGVKLNPREVDAIDPMTGKPFHHYRNRVASNSGGVLTYEDGRMEDINRFAVPRIIQVIFDDPTNNNRWYDFDNAYAIADFAQLIKPGDVVAMDWEDGTPINILLFCNSR